MEPDYEVVLTVWKFFLGRRTKDKGFFIGKYTQDREAYYVVHLL